MVNNMSILDNHKKKITHNDTVVLNVRLTEYASIGSIFERHITNLYKIKMPDLFRANLAKDIRIIRSILSKSEKGVIKNKRG